MHKRHPVGRSELVTFSCFVAGAKCLVAVTHWPTVLTSCFIVLCSLWRFPLTPSRDAKNTDSRCKQKVFHCSASQELQACLEWRLKIIWVLLRLLSTLRATLTSGWKRMLKAVCLVIQPPGEWRISWYNILRRARTHLRKQIWVPCETGRDVWDLGLTCEYRARGDSDILKQFYQCTSSCPVLKEQNPVAIGEEQYVDNCVPQKSSIRGNSHPPHLNQRVLPGKDVIIDLRTYELEAPVLPFFQRGNTLIQVRWYSPGLVQGCSTLCSVKFPMWGY